MYVDKIANFIDAEGRLKAYPSKRKRQIFSLYYLASKFEPGKRYTEKQINQILQDWHTFGDWAMLRRDLYEGRFLNREKDCSFYWLEDLQPTLASFGIENDGFASANLS
ncbi:MAG: DUF2087 domain-containing protein [Oscillospiraceae bacterium]|nr:DUF2087 domain-containing protein [Oscillospiraceae bacterium]